jgi:hypothetical protein
MPLRVVGAGLGRTGTLSLKNALEHLLGEPCYHMTEVFTRADDLAFWQAAAEGEAVDWDEVFDGYAATVDWPGASFWREIAAENPDAPVLLSTRADAATWWRSASATIFAGLQGGARPAHDPFLDMWEAITRDRFTSRWREAEPAMAAYEAHNASVRAAIPSERLFEWQPGDGWEPLCSMLGVPVPDLDFPHVNSTEEFNARQQRSDEDARPEAPHAG